MRGIQRWLGDPGWMLGLAVAGVVVASHTIDAGRAQRPEERTSGLASARDGQISADARYLAFQSREDHPSQGDINKRLDVFVRDLRSGAVSLVSSDSFGDPGDGDSTEPSISGDGRRVAFRSTSRNLVPGDTNNFADIFVKDLATGTTTRVSTSAAGEQADGASSRPSISADGRYVSFLSSSRNLVAEDTGGTPSAFRKDLATGRIDRILPTERAQNGR